VLWSNCLDLDGALEGLGLLCGLGVGLSAHDATTPVTLGLLVLLHVALLDGLDELGKLRLVLGADLGDGDDSGGLKIVVSKRSDSSRIGSERTFL
jgi:hypothetical protein